MVSANLVRVAGDNDVVVVTSIVVGLALLVDLVVY